MTNTQIQENKNESKPLSKEEVTKIFEEKKAKKEHAKKKTIS